MNINREGESGTCKRKELEGKEKEVMHGTTALGYFASVFAVIPNEWNILFSSLILGGYVIKRITM